LLLVPEIPEVTQLIDYQLIAVQLRVLASPGLSEGEVKHSRPGFCKYL
jgi:hypothetical protein